MATPLSNDMSRLVNKLARQLGMLPLLPHLPEEYQKPAWAEEIKENTMVTFSRTFPNRIRYLVNNQTTKQKDGWYYLRDEIIGDNKILGITDIDWQNLGNSGGAMSSLMAYGVPDVYAYTAGAGNSSTMIDQMMGYSFNADINSVFSGGAGIYIEQPSDGTPNMFRVVGYSGVSLHLNEFIIFVLLEHKDLNTISPTKMDIFEALARADVANFLYENLKYYDGLETPFVNIDLKLGSLEQEANKRDDIIAKLDDARVTYSNMAQPLIVVQ